MNCENNFNGCTDIVPSNCVKWTGEKYVEYDICVNDTLTRVITFILNKIKEILKGQGILLPDLNFNGNILITELLNGKEVNLINVLQAYGVAIDMLNSFIATINNQLNDFTDVLSYTYPCLDLVPDPCNPTIRFHTLIQAMITKICTLTTQYQNISDSILEIVEDAAGNFMQTSIKSSGGNGIVFSGVGDSTEIVFQALVPPYSPIIYTGTLTDFDINGIGLPNTPVTGWYLCNGNNNTPSSNSLPQNIAGTLKYIIRFN